MPLRPSTRTLGDVKRAVRRTFGDESNVQIDDGDITAWTNDACTEIVEKNHSIKAVSTSQSVVGQALYDFPSPVIAQVEAMTYDGARIPNVDMAEAINDVMSSDPGLKEAAGTPTMWWEWAGQFTLYPTPNSVKDIVLYYTKYPDEVQTDADILPLPNKYFNAIVAYCLWHAFELDEDWNAASVKENHFRVALEEQSEEERVAENLVYPIIQSTDW